MNTDSNSGFAKAQAKNGADIICRRLTIEDHDALYLYLQALSSQSKKRFGPHPFDKSSIFKFYNEQTVLNIPYGAFDNKTNTLIAYAIIRTGYLECDKDRLESYGLELNNSSDCTFAPSVADQWQGLGVGGCLFNFILSDLPDNVKRIILWGGVQADNQRAINYYKKKEFRLLGEFEHHGANFDMLCELRKA